MSEQISHLLLDEYFLIGDDRFLPALRKFNIPGRLANLADRWKQDPRPWARKQILDYIAQPMNCPAHETVIKRLFKHAEAAGDDELMAVFAVAFDRLVRRFRAKHWQYDYKTRQSWHEEYLRSPRNRVPPPREARGKGPLLTPSYQPHKMRAAESDRLFSYHTRYYLRRRAWRYFRRMGFAQPARYMPAVARMLRDYLDDDLANGEHVLDNWSLLHACFGETDVLVFGESLIGIAEGRALRELSPAPQFPKLWQTPGAAVLLLELVVAAQSRLVRVWAIQLLRRDHSDRLKQVSIADIRRMLDHSDEEVQIFGADLLENASLEKLTVDQWVELLGINNLTALATITRLMALHVRPDRVDFMQAIVLACSKPTPVARMGLIFLGSRVPKNDEQREAVAMLASARCASLGKELTDWALQRLETAEAYQADRVARFFDSLMPEIRAAAWEWLKPGARGWDDAVLWSRLIETPYDDVRLRFVEALEIRAKAPGLDASQLQLLWCTVLLGVHRGGRHKLSALRQISDAVRNNPGAAERLLPVLAVAIRSVRPPEARAGLAAIVGAVEARPELADGVARYLPELQLNPPAEALA